MGKTKKSQFTHIEKTLGSLKFAVILISLFSVAMIIGTFLESYYGTEFASKTIYKTVPFMALQLLMGLSIVYAAFLRLPPKKSLYGFYTIHSGLILIVGGSFVTFYSGIDGSITLPPLTPARDIQLQSDILKITDLKSKEVLTYKLPGTAFATNIDAKKDDFHLLEFLPFSDKKLIWKDPKESKEHDSLLSSSEYFIANDNVQQDFILSLHHEATEFKSNITLGPLNIHYLPAPLAQCYEKMSQSGLILWDSDARYCFTPEEQNISIQTTESDKRFLVIKEGRKIYTFFPELSPYPLDKDLNVIQLSKFRIFSKKIFESSPNLFLFGKKVAFFSDEKWHVKDIEKNKSVDLPWMNFTLNLLKHETSKVPVYVPYYTVPIQKDGKLISGSTKALQIKIGKNNYWVRSDKSIILKNQLNHYKIELIKESRQLPYELSLTNFKMDKDPGSNSPASYESFVQLFDSSGAQDYHIFMNNPLKYEGLTFYQASYFEAGPSQYGSVLSVNVDPGRPIKYLGSLLLVLGSIWHFYLRRKKLNKSGVTA